MQAEDLTPQKGLRIPQNGFYKILTKKIFMRSIYKSADIKDGIIVQEYPEGFTGRNEFIETINFKNIEEKTYNLNMNGVLVVNRSVNSNRSYTIGVEHDFPFLKMQFELKGHSHFRSKIAEGIDIVIENDCHQLFFLPAVKGNLHYPSPKRYTLEILLSVHFLKKIFGDQLVELNTFGKLVLSGQPCSLCPVALPVLPQMKAVINEILNCQYSIPLKYIYIENKVAELLVMQVAQHTHRHTGTTASVISKRDSQKLYYAKELIEKNLQEPCTLIELSALAGINDFKLKKGFKELFGNTVFGYLSELRMQKAKLLLEDGSLTIAEVAYDIGYKNPKHFTVAFKRQFGQLPKNYKKRTA